MFNPISEFGEDHLKEVKFNKPASPVTQVSVKESHHNFLDQNKEEDAYLMHLAEDDVLYEINKKLESIELSSRKTSTEAPNLEISLQKINLEKLDSGEQIKLLSADNSRLEQKCKEQAYTIIKLERKTRILESVIEEFTKKLERSKRGATTPNVLFSKTKYWRMQNSTPTNRPRNRNQKIVNQYHPNMSVDSNIPIPDVEFKNEKLSAFLSEYTKTNNEQNLDNEAKHLTMGQDIASNSFPIVLGGSFDLTTDKKMKEKMETAGKRIIFNKPERLRDSVKFTNNNNRPFSHSYQGTPGQNTPFSNDSEYYPLRNFSPPKFKVGGSYTAEEKTEKTRIYMNWQISGKNKQKHQLVNLNLSKKKGGEGHTNKVSSPISVMGINQNLHPPKTSDLLHRINIQNKSTYVSSNILLGNRITAARVANTGKFAATPPIQNTDFLLCQSIKKKKYSAAEE